MQQKYVPFVHNIGIPTGLPVISSAAFSCRRRRVMMCSQAVRACFSYACYHSTTQMFEREKWQSLFLSFLLAHNTNTQAQYYQSKPNSCIYRRACLSVLYPIDNHYNHCISSSSESNRLIRNDPSFVFWLRLLLAIVAPANPSSGLVQRVWQRCI